MISDDVEVRTLEKTEFVSSKSKNQNKNKNKKRFKQEPVVRRMQGE